MTEASSPNQHATPASQPDLAALHDQFVTRIMPAVERHARIYFRHLRCQHRKQEAVADAVALAWRSFARLAERGKDGSQFPSIIAKFAACAVHNGRRVCGHEKPNDVLSPIAQRRRGFEVTALPDHSTLEASPIMDALIENTRTPVDDQVCFRVDFRTWLETLGPRNRRMVMDMSQGERTRELSERYKVSESRISQLRRAARNEWGRYERDWSFDRNRKGKP